MAYDLITRTALNARMQAAVLTMSTIGVAIVLLGTSRYGIGLSPDSVIYISAARSLLSGHGYLMHSGAPFVVFPPLFPTVLAGMGLLGIEPLLGARLINAIMFGLIVFAAGQLIQRHVHSRVLAVVGTASICLSLPILDVSMMAWTEPLFIVLSILFVILAARFLVERTLISLLAMSALASLCFLQRYAGITIVLTGFLLIGFTTKSISIRHRFEHLVLFGFVSLSPGIAWMIRNYILTTTLTGGRSSSEWSVLQNMRFTFDVVTRWFLPYPGHTPFAIQVAFGGLGVAILVITGIFLRHRLNNRPAVEWAQTTAMGLFVVVYVSYLIVASTVIHFDTINNRLLAPIYIFVLLFMLIGAEETSTLANRLAGRISRARHLRAVVGLTLIVVGISLNELLLAKLFSPDGSLQARLRIVIGLFDISLVFSGSVIVALRRREWLGDIVIIGLCAILLVYPFISVYDVIDDGMRTGIGGYNRIAWKESPIIDWLEMHPLEGTIYSNAPYGIYILTGIPGPKFIPSRSQDISQFKASLSTVPNNYLVWFDASPRYYYDLPGLLSELEVVEVAVFPDGGVYSVR